MRKPCRFFEENPTLKMKKYKRAYANKKTKINKITKENQTKRMGSL